MLSFFFLDTIAPEMPNKSSTVLFQASAMACLLAVLFEGFLPVAAGPIDDDRYVEREVKNLLALSGLEERYGTIF